jgi:hypothetical protein
MVRQPCGASPKYDMGSVRGAFRLCHEHWYQDFASPFCCAIAIPINRETTTAM